MTSPTSTTPAPVDVGAWRRPPRLRPGDTVGVATPSSPAPAAHPDRFRRGLAALESFGFQVQAGAMSAASGGSAADRAAEVNGFLRDPKVRGVFFSIGGWTANAVLPLLDYPALARDPKVIVGYSDLTALLVACARHAQVVVFHGPTVMPELGEFPTPLSYTVEGLLAAITRPEPLGRLTAPARWTEEFLPWGERDDRPRRDQPADAWAWLAPGAGEGVLAGGNLDTLSVLLGTDHAPRPGPVILLVETVATDLAQVERSLTHLDQAGLLDPVVGLVVGRSFRGPVGFEARLQDLFARWFADRGVPVLAGVDLGHTDPMLTLPLGVRARLDSATDTFEVLDAGVC